MSCPHKVLDFNRAYNPHKGGIRSQDNVRIVQGLYEAGARGDLPAMLAHLAPDFVAYESDALPFGGVYRGPKGFTPLRTCLPG